MNFCSACVASLDFLYNNILSQVVVASDKTKVFNFDLMFDQTTPQEQVYQDLVEHRVDSVIQGYNATVFAYGQTGSGKTFSMGTNNSVSTIEDDSRGVCLRALRQIFDALKQDSTVQVKISFLEIFREQAFDLLQPKRVALSVRELKPGCFKVVDLTEEPVSSVAEAVELLSRGGQVRSTEATALNTNSSRSHAVFSISLVTSDGVTNITRKLNLVDLAGSENSNKTKCVGSRFEEAKSINLGLTVLSRVITGLSKKQPHIPFRESVLTKVLKESLESHCYVSMLACISPDAKDVHETINTLRLSNEAKQLKTKPLPASILASCRSSTAQKRRQRLGLTTPLARANNTIAATPRDIRPVKRPAFNNTIGTPGKRAKTEARFTGAAGASRGQVTSTTSKNFLTESLCSDVSMIEPPSDSIISSTTATSINTFDMSSLVSPLRRTIREEIERVFNNKINSKQETKTPQKTPVKLAKSRATSSPNKTITTLDMTEDSAPSSTIQATDDKENFISGVGVTFPRPPRSVNPRLHEIINSASPTLANSLPDYSSTASSSTVRRPLTQDLTSVEADPSMSPTMIEEMERTLGINPESPVLFCSEPTTVKRRSSRRATMMNQELNETLLEFQEATGTRRRNPRRAAQGKFYGSPRLSKEDCNHQPEETTETTQQPTMMNPEKQRRHNDNILNIINTGNQKELAVSLLKLFTENFLF